MLNVLEYLFENYLPGSCPEPRQLARKLRAVGFDQEEIVDAINWLGALDSQSVVNSPRIQATTQAYRVYTDSEAKLLPLACRSLIALLEQHRGITPEVREIIIDRALHLAYTTGGELDTDELKIMVLAVLWHKQIEPDIFLLEELLYDTEDLDDRVIH